MSTSNLLRRLFTPKGVRLLRHRKPDAWQSIVADRQFEPKPAVASTATWNPADKNANVALTNGDKTASASTTTADNGVRSTLFRSTGKFCVGFQIGAVGSELGIGFATADASLSAWAAQSTSGIVAYQNANSAYTQSTPSTSPAFAGGSYILACYDMDADLVWFLNGTTYPATGYDPGAGTGGRSYQGGFAGQSNAPYAAPKTTGDIVTIDHTCTSCPFALPSGFSAWEAGVASPSNQKMARHSFWL